MPLHRAPLTPCLLLAACALFLAAAPATRDPSTTGKSLESLLARLGSDDFTERTRAQSDLERLDYHALASLKTTRDAATDPEVKARLTTRIQQIEELNLLDPPPISLTFKNVRWNAMIAGLKEATGAQIEGYGDDATFSIDAHDKPFWEVFRELSRQTPPALAAFSGSINLSQTGEDKFRSFTVSGPFAFAARDISRTANFQDAAPNTVLKHDFHFLVAADPRLLVVRYLQPVVSSAIDENGNQWISGNGEPAASPSSGIEYFWKARAALTPPQNPGRKIATLKGFFRVELVAAFTEMTIDDPATRLNQEFTVAQRAITVTKWEPYRGNEGFVQFEAKVTRTDVPMADPHLEFPCDPVICFLVDRSNAIIGQSTHLKDGGSGSFSSGEAPIKLKIVVPTKTKILDIPFEFKDLTLP